MANADDYAPAFAETFHIRPWEIGKLTVKQFLDLKYVIDERNKR